MHFHLPKPLHGWRAFVGEVGIIVLGVLIALAAEQVVEALHWRREVAEARKVLGYEIADSIGEGYEREHIYDCVEGRLDLLAATVDQAAATGRLPPMASPGSPPFRTWLSAAWQTLGAGQTASHFPRRELNLYADIYVFVDNMQQVGPRELTVWSRLNAIAGPGRRFDPAEAESLRNDIAEARLLNRLATTSGLRMREAADGGGIAYDAAVVRNYARTPNSKFAVCGPMIGPPPPHYGGVHYPNPVERLRAEQLVLPAK